MAAFETTRPAPQFGPGLFTRRLRAAISAVQDWNDARITRKALSRLTARELDDIGLKRSDIEHIVSGSYR